MFAATVGFRETDHDVAVGYNVYAPSTQVKLNVYDIGVNRLRASLTGHTWLISCVHLPASVPHQLVTGSADRKIRQYDLRAGCSASLTLIGHVALVSTVQMDDWKIVSGDDGGFVYVWDQRMARKLWDIYNRHPVSYCWFDDRLLITANVPYQKFPHQDEFETVSSLRYRGTVQVYDFMANQQTQGVPDICLSSYNEPEASDYNIGLTVPYDVVE
ncbi:F-box/WD repeat-containing protein 8 [Bulinus truncatus]|nr:F-box/WD repeat-containing protein 8 [Bulinus truncatus]